MRSFLTAALALLVGCAAPTRLPTYANVDLDADAKRFEPTPGKARIYATTNRYSACSWAGCLNGAPIAASVFVDFMYAGDLTGLDNFVFVDVNPGDVDLYFMERGTTHKPLVGAHARIRAEAGGVYFYRLSGGARPRTIYDGGTILERGGLVDRFAAEQLSEAGRQHITERRLVLSSEYPRFPETRLAGRTQPSTSSPNPVSGNPAGLASGSQPSTSSSDRAGDAAEAAGRVTGFVLETAFYLALGAASARRGGSYPGGNWGNQTGVSNAELTMYCSWANTGPVLGTTECRCNSNNQYFTSIIVQGAACPSFIHYNVTNNTWRH